MFCSKCGSAVTGKYCCVCGARVLNPVEEFRKEQRKRKSDFKAHASYPAYGRFIAEACWAAAEVKYDLTCGVVYCGMVLPDAYNRLQKADTFAHRLYEQIMISMDSNEEEV